MLIDYQTLPNHETVHFKLASIGREKIDSIPINNFLSKRID